MKFMGAAQQPFNSFMDLARSTLDTHCHNWNNPSDPRSYILPPVCSFKNADKSDQDIEKIKIKVEQMQGSSAKSLNQIQRPVLDRRSDSGEFVVFYALWTLIQDKVDAPFLAIHGLNLDNVRRYLQQIFPKAQVDIEKEFEAMMREYDFVLIGPKIGMIVIEVKSTQFTKGKDFAENSRHLPDHITYALKDQLGSFDPTIFEVFSESETAQKIPIRKILFTPNLEKRRFETWINRLDDAIKKKVMDKFDGVTHWFSEDMDNKCSQKPPLYSTLREEIEKNGYEISQEIFESYGLIISGLRSAVVLQNRTTISTERLSISSAILKDATSLESHNPKRQGLDKNAAGVIEVESKLVLLTPKQQEILNGPNRQFIIGAPGTGKTIIIQAKIAQLLKQGKKVLIVAGVPYHGKYKKLFSSHDSCKVYGQQQNSYFPQLTEEFLKEIMAEDGKLSETLEKLSENMVDTSVVRLVRQDKSGKSVVQEDLRDFDGIFIDDAFDWPHHGPDWKSKRILESLFLMLMANSKFCSKLVWVACDSYLNDSDDEAYGRILNQIIRGEQGEYFSTSVLNRVMRSSESVFQATYTAKVMEHLAKEPVIGHRIHGFYDIVHLRNLSVDDALLEIWKHTYSSVRKFKEDGFDYGHMAIIVGGERELYPYIHPLDIHECLFDKFKQNGIPVRNNSKGLLGIPAEDNHTVTIDDWDIVSSFEWPVVIYIGMFVAHERRVSEAYNRYRACSRATMNLFEINADIENYIEALDFYKGENALYVLVFHKQQPNLLNISSVHESTDQEFGGEHLGKVFKRILGWDFTIYKVDLKEIPGVGKDFLDLLSPTNEEEQGYLERRKKNVALTLDGLEYYCRRGGRLNLFECIVKGKTN